MNTNTIKSNPMTNRTHTHDQLARLIANAHMGLQPATPAEVRAAERAVAKADGITVRQVRARERQAHTRLAGRGKLYRADILGKGVQA